ncbi:hypothetical protein LCGC14_1553210, partial [marine sediment metagenome]
MKKIINDVDTFMDESLRGFSKAHADIVSVNYQPTFVFRRECRPEKVAIISGGGSGHEPL